MQDYELIDFGDGEKLERWGDYILRRPDQNAFGSKTLGENAWNDVHMHFHRDSKDKEYWEIKKQIPEEWHISYKALTFAIKPTAYKHTGLFPEQRENWDWIIKKIQGAGRPVKVLNLFGYTGGSSIAAAYGGASEVVHIDSSKGANSLAKENQKLSGLSDKNIRFITEDAKKFVAKELKRGNKYDALILDPPLYGRGPSGELWKIDKDLIPLLNECLKLLSTKPLFVLINLYAGNNLEKEIRNLFGREVEIEEVSLDIPVKAKNSSLHTGVVFRIKYP